MVEKEPRWKRWRSPSNMIFDRKNLSSADARKKALQHAEILAFQDEWKTQKQLTREKEQQEKRQNLKMLQEYYPWDQNGKRTEKTAQPKILINGKKPSDGYNGNKVLPAPDKAPVKAVAVNGNVNNQEFLKFGGPGHGAPNRTSSGRVQTTLQGDLDIRFTSTQEVGKSIENHLRYKNSPNATKSYRQDLDGLLEIKKLSEKKDKEIEKKLDKDMITKFPFGVADNQTHQRNKPDSLFFSTLPFYPKRRQSSHMKNGFLQPVNKISSKSTVSVVPAPKIGWLLPPWDQTTSPEQSYSKPYKYCRTPEEKQEYLDCLKKEMKQKQEEKLQDEKEQREADKVDLVPLMLEKQVGKSRRDGNNGQMLNHSLPSTDVTSHGKLFFKRVNNLPKKTVKNRTYLEELEMQAKEKQVQHQKLQQKENQESEKHFEAWSKLWGRPGNGAPNDNMNHKKENLWRMLLESSQKQVNILG